MDTRIVLQDDELSAFRTMTLGQLIMVLQPHAVRREVEEEDVHRTVYFDFCGMAPSYFCSYRGYYNHLAIVPSRDAGPKASDFIAKLRAADGEVFDGYKGGSYRMDLDTPIWAAYSSDSGSTAIIGLMVEGWRITLLTDYRPG